MKKYNFKDLIIPKEEWENCPQCKNEGVIPEHDPMCDGSCYNCPVPVQCEFCWTNEKSVFYQKQIMEKTDE